MDKTSLHDKHLKQNAKMVEFSGYSMPINYPLGIKDEYYSVRDDIGIFDVSHMGVFKVSGSGSMELLDHLLSNNISILEENRAMYTLLCNKDGGIIDDLIVYKIRDFYILIVNASNKNKNYKWIDSHLTNNVTISDLSDSTSLIAVQGPSSRNKIQEILNLSIGDLSFYHCKEQEYLGEKIFIARTGYTGELGYEILGNHDIINSIWDSMISNGVKPAGLGVRDVLRIEMGYCLYGHEIDEAQNPIEAGLRWIISEKPDSIGLKNIFDSRNHKKKIIFIKMLDRGIPREGCSIYLNDQNIGYITSGTFSYKLKCGIGIGYIDNVFTSINEVSIMIRNKLISAEISNRCFLLGTSLKK